MAVAFKQGYSISGILTVGTASLPWSEYYYRMASFWTPESVLFIIAVSLIQIRDSEVALRLFYYQPACMCTQCVLMKYHNVHIQ